MSKGSDHSRITAKLQKSLYFCDKCGKGPSSCGCLSKADRKNLQTSYMDEFYKESFDNLIIKKAIKTP